MPRSRGRERRMACPEPWQVAVLWVCSLCTVVRTTHASSSVAPSESEARPLLARVEIAMIGGVEQDPALFERIRSLFPSDTAVVERTADHIDQRAVLLPQRADTVYIWIRVTGQSARVYLALSEEPGQARYLFREISLEEGVDEVGGETLAEIAHSSAQALWLRQSQTPRKALEQALERETEPPRTTPPPSESAKLITTPSAADSLNAETTRRPASKAGPLRLALGASESAHAAGAEGLLHEPGLFLGLEYRARFSLRLAARYLVPAEFDLTPARVRLSGPSGEARVGFLTGGAGQKRFRLEAGFGLLWGHAEAAIVDEQPQAHALAAQNFQRAYALAAALFEWPLGPAWLAVGGDLRVPFAKASYEVAGQGGPRVSPAVYPGGSLEVGIGFDPGVR